jgi:hypothetical protein
MDPRIFNDRKLREAVIPAANGHFSARALAKFYAALLGGRNGGGAGTQPPPQPLLLSAERVARVSREWARGAASVASF